MVRGHAKAHGALAQQKTARDQELKKWKKGKSSVFLASKKVLIVPEWPRGSYGQCGSLS